MSGSFDDSEDVGVGRQVRRSPAERWAINTPSAQREDRLPLEKATVKWARIYALFSASGERAQDEVFSAVNAYFLVNGCSPRGKYSRDVKTAGGLSVPIGEVVKITGVLDGDIRQFLRARLKDSYECLKYSPSLQVDESFRDKAERKGVPRDMCYVMADWLSECEYFTADESRVAASLSTKNIAEANARYDASGKSHNTRVNEIVEVTTPEGLRNGVRHEESLHASY